MASPLTRLIWLGLLLLGTAAQAQDQPLLDADGDPLPLHAVARIGTMRLRHAGQITALAFSRDGKTLASSARDETLSLWDVAIGKELRRIPVGEALGQFHFGEQGKELFADSYRGIRRWDIDTGKESKPIATQFGQIVFSVKGDRAALRERLYTSPGNLAEKQPRVVKVIDLVKGPLRQFESRSRLSAIALSPDGQLIAIGEPGGVQLWDVDTGKALHRIAVDLRTDLAGGDGLQLVFSPDSRTLFIGYHGTSTWVVGPVDVRTGKAQGKPIYTDVTWVISSPDGERLAAPDYQKPYLQILHVASQKQRDSVPHAGITALAYSPDGKTLATGGIDGRIHLWDVRTEEKRLSFSDPGNGPGAADSLRDRDSQGISAQILADEKTFAISGTDRILRFHDLATGREVRRLGPWPRGRLLDLSRDGTVLAVDGGYAADEGCFFGPLLYRVDKGARLGLLREPEKSLKTLQANFAPDGNTLTILTAKATDQVGRFGLSRVSDYRVWQRDVATGKAIRESTQSLGEGGWLKVSPDGSALALSTAGRENSSISIWDVPRSGPFKEPRQIQKMFQAIGFSPDNRFLAVWNGEDEPIELWEQASLTLAMTLPAIKQFATAIAYSSSGRFLALATESGKIKLWDVPAGKEIAQFIGHRGAVRSLAFSRDNKRLVSGGSDFTALIWDVSTLLKPAALPRQELDSARLKALWSELGESDTRRAFAAVRLLAGNPQQGLLMLRDNLKPVPPVLVEKITRLIADVESGRFAVRTHTLAELAKLGYAAVPALQKALAEKPSLEARRRMEQLLVEIDRAGHDPEKFRLLRALLVLEYIGTGEAGTLLERLVAGAPGAWLTEQARASLRRLRQS